ncbi:50S ribosomal protein-like protein Mrp49 [Xylogone sp. PMI_703]|nr:50S ribosomal protein-like protein Mrp49 [Xylogone sp. PMI_703]
MVSVISRVTKLRTLLSVRLGPGAAILPPEITKIHMDFAAKINDGHQGPRKFWRNCLPRLKYHNPSVSMTVNRTTNQEGPALMTIHFNDQTASSEPNENVVTINMKHKPESEILSQFMTVSKAKPVAPTPDETQLMRDLEEQRARSERDSQRMKLVNEKRKRQEAILIQARGEVAASQEL